MGRCIVCAQSAEGKLCAKCKKSYIYDRKLKGARLRKIFGSKAAKRKHNYKTERRLYLILRGLFKEVYRDLRPEWCPSPKGVALEYDFCIPKKKILIELDGPYHWDRSLYKTDAAFKYRILCDHIKEDIAKKEGWDFYRICLAEEKVTKDYVKKLLGRKSPKIKKFRRL